MRAAHSRYLDMPQEGFLPRLHFKGKVFVENHHLAVPFHELLPMREKGLSEKAGGGLKQTRADLDKLEAL